MHVRQSGDPVQRLSLGGAGFLGSGRPAQHLRDAATVLGLAAVIAGLLGVAVSGPDYHGPTGLPWGAVTSYLFGAAVLRVIRTQPFRSAATR